MRNLTLLSLLFITVSAHAEVYKCQVTTKQIVYQSTPCSANTADKDIVKIEKLDAHQQEEALNRLKATEAERQALDKAEQERRQAAAEQWQQQAIQRELAAARQDAAAARWEAEQARQSSTILNSPYPVYIPYPNYGYGHQQRPMVSPYYSPNPSFSPNPPLNPSFSPNPSPYPPPYMR